MKTGLYEQVVSRTLADKLAILSDEYRMHLAGLDEAEAPAVLSQYVTDLLRKELERISESSGELADMVNATNHVIAAVEALPGKRVGLQIKEEAQQLLSLYTNSQAQVMFGHQGTPPRPDTSISSMSLFTGAAHEPGLYSEFKKEIASCDSIDMLVSFIRWSGLVIIMDDLRAFAQRGGRLRVITTSYMGATQIKAIDELCKLEGAQIRISYDGGRTRLHAKAYLFHRDTGFSTAYVGSSNISRPAISSGLEWNVKVSEHEQKDTMKKIMATFDVYWHSEEFEAYTLDQHDRLVQALNKGRVGHDPLEISYLFDIEPYPFQQEILNALEAERKVRGHWKNLVIAATGTGKTVIAAFDYKRYCRENPGKRNTLLFIAHREEILRQSLGCFRGVLRDPNFGDLFVGNERPENTTHLFMSIQTFNSRSWEKVTAPNDYDFIIVDEFHRAAAPSYQTLLSYYKPKILLGLTATPERMDGRDVLEYFDQRISAEIRLPEAIDRKLLSPFQYFGVSDTVDLDSISWSRGGYDERALSLAYTGNKEEANRRVDNIVSSLVRYTADMDALCSLAFCVSVEHAHFMAKAFCDRGVPSIALTGATETEQRRSAAERLAKGELKILCVVDIYNEGVDIPELNTVLFLRPTQSLTVFLQQLGRGLRLHEGKDCLTVLDFIGQAHKKYSFENKYAALLAGTRRRMVDEIALGFPSLPKGCYIVLEKVARKHILDNIRAHFSYRAGMVEQIRAFFEDVLERDRNRFSLTAFLEHARLDPRNLYHWDSFARLCVDGRIIEDFDEPMEQTLRGAWVRLCSIDSRRWLAFLIALLEGERDGRMLSPLEQRMIRMFVWAVWAQNPRDAGFDSPEDAIRALRACPVLCSEILDLLKHSLSRVGFVDEPVDLGFDSPLDLHCSYAKNQIFAALDLPNPASMREGVRYLREKKLDVFLITLNKSEKDYSPSTMYRDYCISQDLFHWQSQSTTAQNSATGQRYIQHKQMGVRTLLFVRENKTDAKGALPFRFLGMADYVSHEGEKPMSITYKLHRPAPAMLLK